jgi:hypothetical protein
MREEGCLPTSMAGGLLEQWLEIATLSDFAFAFKEARRWGDWLWGS